MSEASHHLIHRVFWPETQDPKHNGEDWLLLFLIGVIIALLFLASCERGNTHEGQINLPTWGETPTEQKQPSNALFP